MTFYCETCEDYQEFENGRCTLCGSKRNYTEEKTSLDDWSEFDDEEEGDFED